MEWNGPNGTETMTKRISAKLFVWVGVAALPHLAQADTFYHYVGPVFTSVTSPFTTTESISGTMDFATPLSANTTYSSLSPSSWWFSDGVTSFSSSNGDTLVNSMVSTDGAGNISGYRFQIGNAELPGFGSTAYASFCGYAAGTALQAQSFCGSHLGNVALLYTNVVLSPFSFTVIQAIDGPTPNLGFWTTTGSTPSTPEPSTALALMSGLFALALLARKRSNRLRR
jgi:hypothetical protein